MLPTIIAEIGLNHEGELDAARRMIAEAGAAGADWVKFQSFRPSDIALPTSEHFDLIKRCALDYKTHEELMTAARDAGVGFMSTPFSIEMVEWLEQLAVGAYKIASMDCTNRELLEAVARTGKPIYLSTGMAELAEIGEALDFLGALDSGPVTLLHCLSLYPTPASKLNLDAIPFLRETFNVPVGYSDHYPGIEACVLAGILGSVAIETHFTFDPERAGMDHGHSVDAAGIRELRSRLDLAEQMRGARRSVLTRPDQGQRDALRRGVYAARELQPGERITRADLLTCRPAAAYGPSDIGKLLGREVIAPVGAYSAITDTDIG